MVVSGINKMSVRRIKCSRLYMVVYFLPNHVMCCSYNMQLGWGGTDLRRV